MITALQGAFVEHKMVLERLIFKTILEIILVRTPEDLCRCDALIIPGGGMSTLTLFPFSFHSRSVFRKYGDSLASPTFRCTRTIKGICETETCMGDMRRRYPTLSSSQRS